MNRTTNCLMSEANEPSQPKIHSTRKVIIVLCFTWSIFQLYVASVLPFVFTEWSGLSLVFNNQEIRQIHLAFALALARWTRRESSLLKSTPHKSSSIWEVLHRLWLARLIFHQFAEPISLLVS